MLQTAYTHWIHILDVEVSCGFRRIPDNICSMDGWMPAYIFRNMRGHYWL